MECVQDDIPEPRHARMHRARRCRNHRAGLIPCSPATPRSCAGRGAFFTPAPVAGFLVDWAVRDASDAVLEPSCGEAVFLHAVARHVGKDGRLVGVELHAASAQRAACTLAADGVDARIHTGDFFAHNEFGRYNAVVGNPPYVRYQDFSGADRANAQRAMLRGGVRLTNLASSWAAFTVHAALHLRTGGRLALVLPAELLTVNYAGAVRRFRWTGSRTSSWCCSPSGGSPRCRKRWFCSWPTAMHPTWGTGTDP